MISKIPFIASAIKNYLRKKYEKFPALLSIEITTACNAKCIMCPRETMARPIKHMPYDVFEKIVEDCKNKPVKKINLFWFGDPFSNPRVIQYMEKIRKELPKVKLYVSTNAELLKPEHSDEILEKNLVDVINFDIDGTTKETYESVRVGVTYETVVNNVNYFIDKKKSLGLRKPQVRTTIINMKETQDEVEDFKKYWKSRADKVDVNEYNTWLGSKEDKNVGNALERSQQGAFTYPCTHPWNELVISAEGVAGLCCLDYNLTAEIGDVKKYTIEELWQGPVLNDYREKMIRLEYDKIDCCSKCNAYIYQDNTLWAKLWRSR